MSNVGKTCLFFITDLNSVLNIGHLLSFGRIDFRYSSVISKFKLSLLALRRDKRNNLKAGFLSLFSFCHSLSHCLHHENFTKIVSFIAQLIIAAFLCAVVIYSIF